MERGLRSEAGFIAVLAMLLLWNALEDGNFWLVIGWAFNVIMWGLLCVSRCFGARK